MPETVIVGLIQMACGESAESNVEKAFDRIRQAADSGAQVICTQELFKTPYFAQAEDHSLFQLAETVGADSPTVRELRELARELEVVLIASLFERQSSGLFYNASVVIDADGEYLGKYRKMHIPDDPLYYEKFFFAPGDLGYQVFHTRYADIGVLICWDQWFPEAARLTAMKGAQIIFYPTAIGYYPGHRDPGGIGGHDAWQTVQRGHAVANACYVAAVNRVGFEPNPAGEGGLEFWGQSFIADPSGAVVAQASESEEETLIEELDLSLIEDTRRSLAHFFRDRRIDSYGGLTKRYLDE
jgi:N-carbamoylputrescine amidase